MTTYAQQIAGIAGAIRRIAPLCGLTGHAARLADAAARCEAEGTGDAVRAAGAVCSQVAFEIGASRQGDFKHLALEHALFSVASATAVPQGGRIEVAESYLAGAARALARAKAPGKASREEEGRAASYRHCFSSP